jgi:hypothetical protein
MARRPRLFARGLLYHVIVRGNQRRKTFVDKEDYWESSCRDCNNPTASIPVKKSYRSASFCHCIFNLLHEIYPQGRLIDRLFFERLWHLRCGFSRQKFNEGEETSCKWKERQNCGASGKLVVIRYVRIQIMSENTSSALERAITSAQRVGRMSIQLK